MGWCGNCGQRMPDDQLGVHLVEVHEVEIDRWPDGEPVIVDLTLQPEDFD